MKKASLKVRTDGATDRDSLVISVREAELLQNAVDELQNGGSFTAGFFTDAYIFSSEIKGREFVRKNNAALVFRSLGEKGKVRILIKPDKALIKISVRRVTFPFDDYIHRPVCAFIDVGSFRYALDLQDVDGQLRVSKKALTFTVRNVRGNL